MPRTENREADAAVRAARAAGDTVVLLDRPEGELPSGEASVVIRGREEDLTEEELVDVRIGRQRGRPRLPRPEEFR